MQSVHELVDFGVCLFVCVNHGTAGKEVLLAGITWFSKCQGSDVLQQSSRREA